MTTTERPRLEARDGTAAMSSDVPRLPGVLRLVDTEHDRWLLALRLVLAAVIIPHGMQHTFGAFGGFGFDASRDFMAKVTGVPVALASVACVLEIVAPIALALGALGRVAAGWLFAFLAVAATTHASNGFFMNWLGNQRGEGFEYHVLVLALAGTVVARGSGALSVDRQLAAWCRRAASSSLESTRAVRE